MSRPRIFVVQPIPEETITYMEAFADVEVYPYTDRQCSVDALTAAARRNDYLFTMHETFIPRRVIESNPHLRGVVAWAWGAADKEYEAFIDVAACEEFDVDLMFFPEDAFEVARATNAKATADLTLAMLMCLAFRVPEADAYTKAGRFRQEMTMDLMGVGLTNRSVGLIGLGVVARELVPRLRAFDLEVRYTKRTRLDADDETKLGVTWVEHLDDLVAEVDYVCMMANYHPDALKLMGASQFALMKPTAYFINSGRCRLVDEHALIEALQTRSIAGAGLDVFWNEPPVTHDPFVPIPLRQLSNVVLQPHNGGATWESRVAETMAVAEAIVHHIKTNA